MLQHNGMYVVEIFQFLCIFIIYIAHWFLKVKPIYNTIFTIWNTINKPHICATIAFKALYIYIYVYLFIYSFIHSLKLMDYCKKKNKRIIFLNSLHFHILWRLLRLLTISWLIISRAFTITWTPITFSTAISFFAHAACCEK